MKEILKMENHLLLDSLALVAASELSGLLETAHLLRSPKNAERLLTALNRALSNKHQPQSLEQLKYLAPGC